MKTVWYNPIENVLILQLRFERNSGDIPPWEENMATCYLRYVISDIEAGWVYIGEFD